MLNGIFDLFANVLALLNSWIHSYGFAISALTTAHPGASRVVGHNGALVPPRSGASRLFVTAYTKTSHVN